MKHYQIYLIDADGRLRLGERFTCVDDKAALERFHIAGLRSAELWQAGRPVAKVDRNGRVSLGAPRGER